MPSTTTSPTPKPAGKYCHLTTTYTSSISSPFTHVSPPIPAPSSQKDRVAYLASLKTATTEVQKVINDELTARMEEDKKKAQEDGEREAGNAGGTKKRKADVDDEEEEDNYGEEVADEED